MPPNLSSNLVCTYEHTCVDAFLIRQITYCHKRCLYSEFQGSLPRSLSTLPNIQFITFSRSSDLYPEYQDEPADVKEGLSEVPILPPSLADSAKKDDESIGIVDQGMYVRYVMLCFMLCLCYVKKDDESIGIVDQGMF